MKSAAFNSLKLEIFKYSILGRGGTLQPSVQQTFDAHVTIVRKVVLKQTVDI